MASQERVYYPKDTLTRTFRSTTVTAGAGALLSGIQNTLSRQNIGAWGIFTRTGSTIAVFAAMGGTYEFVKSSSANLREKDDSWNEGWGGLVAGSILGLTRRSVPHVLGFGAMLAVVLGTFDYTGGALSGIGRDPDADEYERKQALRKNRRRPIQETIDELGEGRGIYGPGYAERRAERIKANYGIDVPKTAADS